MTRRNLLAGRFPLALATLGAVLSVLLFHGHEAATSYAAVSADTQTFVPYDDFSSGGISVARWSTGRVVQPGFVRQVQAGQLVIEHQSSGPIVQNNSLQFQSDPLITAIQADVAVLDARPQSIARLGGTWYMTTNALDVFAQIAITNDGTGLYVEGLVGNCTDANCTSTQNNQRIRFLTTSPGRTHRLVVAWTGELFVVGVDGDLRTIDPRAAAPIVQGLPLLHFKVIGTRLFSSTAASSITATFDNVFINPARVGSFAEKVVSFTPGTNTGEDQASAAAALGPPNAGSPIAGLSIVEGSNDLSLGCGGVLVVEFVNDRLIDVPGPDLEVFEVGPSIELFQVEVSADGGTFFNLGVHGSVRPTQIDIGPLLPSNAPREFRFVRITDKSAVCGAPTAGADIDAIGIVSATAATVTSVTGTVQVTLQGELVGLGSQSSVVKGMQLTTEVDGQLQATCNDGNRFALSSKSSVFLDDAFCDPLGSGLVDVTQGTLSLVSGVTPASESTRRTRALNQAAGVRTPVSVGRPVGSGADFNISYAQTGRTGTAIVTVTRGSVEVTDLATGLVTNVTVGQPKIITGTVPDIVAAILPSSRSVQVGTAATAFALMINTGTTAAIVCQLSRLTDLPAAFSFQTTVPATNRVIGSKSTPVSIAPGGLQSFVVALTPSGPFPPTDVQLSFACGGTVAPIVVGLNTLLLSASASPVPDLVALAATVNNDGIVNIPGASGTGFFAVATVNLGAGGPITVSADTGIAALPVSIALCQTNPDGSCRAAPASTVTTQIDAGATPTFAIFVAGSGVVPFDPANKRIFVRFKDAGGVTRGSTNVAARTQ